MSEVDAILNKARTAMDKTIANLEDNFANVRTGRANAMVLNRIMVDYYGTPTPINQMAGVKTPEAHLLVIEPWDKSSVKDIERANPRQRPGRHPEQRQHRHPPSVPLAHRGAPQGAGEAVPHLCRGSARGRAQRPPRRQRCGGEGHQER